MCVRVCEREGLSMCVFMFGCLWVSCPACVCGYVCVCCALADFGSTGSLTKVTLKSKIGSYVARLSCLCQGYYSLAFYISFYFYLVLTFSLQIQFSFN